MAIADAFRRNTAESLPGLALVAVCAAVAFGINQMESSVSPLVASVAIGALLANLGLTPRRTEAGAKFSSKRLLRLGVVLLGFQLSFTEVADLGGRGFVVVLIVVASTFFGTRWLGSRMGVSKPLSLLIATGFSICGASAIAAMKDLSDAEEDEVAFSIGLVTLCGSLAILALPLLRSPLGLDTPALFGSWVGASVHDVGQVVATSASGGAESVRAAVVVKLTRVLLLAPLVAGVGLARQRNGARGGCDKRPPLVPLFVVGFILAVAIRSTGAMNSQTLDAIKTIETVLLSMALVALGMGVRYAKLRKLGGRPVVLALISWLTVALVAYAGVLVS